MSVRYVFVDESSTSGGCRHMVFGGVMADEAEVQALGQRMVDWRARTGLGGELKWTSIDQLKKRAYGVFVKGVVHYAKAGVVTISTTIFESSKVNYKKYHYGNAEYGYYSLMCHFLLHSFLVRCLEGDRVHLVFDERTTLHGLPDMVSRLNRMGRQKGWWAADIVASQSTVKSHRSVFVQAADVFAGAAACQNNGNCSPESNRGVAKLEVAAAIERHAGIDFRRCTRGPREPLKVWHFNLDLPRRKQRAC